MERRPYARSPLAKARKAAGLSQTEACAKLGIKHKQHLSSIETGRVQASQAVMRAMVEAYQSTPAEILRAATDTFEAGVVLQRHRRRQLKVAALPVRKK